MIRRFIALDLLQLDGRDLRDKPIEAKASWRAPAGSQPLALVFNGTCDDPGLVVFEHACKLGSERIVSKRSGSRYARGRSSNWLGAMSGPLGIDKPSSQGLD
jgi:bifunctional non-homologous end joining protein LigD